MRRIILAVLVMWMAFSLTPIAAQQGKTYYVNVRAAKMRADAKSTAKLVTTLARGTAVVILDVVTGEKISGVDKWYKVNAGGKKGYMLSSLLTDRVPVAASSSTGNSGSNGGNNNSTTPASSPIPPVVRAGTGCGGATTCGQMASCEQAYACLNAGNGRLDRDNDGVPCESICPGG